MDGLTKKQYEKYDDSLEVLRRMRKGETLTEASKKVRISSRTVKRYVGSALYKKGRRFMPLKTDSLLRKMKIYENGEKTHVQIRGNKTARDIARYHSSIGILLNDKNKQKVMEEFTELKIVDYKGKVHRLETRVKVLNEIAERREGNNTTEIYFEY